MYHASLACLLSEMHNTQLCIILSAFIHVVVKIFTPERQKDPS